MSILPDGPAPLPGPEAAEPAIPAGARLADVVVFLLFLLFCLALLDLAAGWALTGVLHLGPAGMPVLWAVIGVPLGWAGIMLARTALAAHRERAGPPDA